MVRISEADFKEWRESPVTLEFMKFLIREAKARRFLLGSGGGIDRSKGLQDVGEQTYKLLTQAEIYELLTGIEYEDMLDLEEVE